MGRPVLAVPFRSISHFFVFGAACCNVSYPSRCGTQGLGKPAFAAAGTADDQGQHR
jgi:hypothetical protein